MNKIKEEYLEIEECEYLNPPYDEDEPTAEVAGCVNESLEHRHSVPHHAATNEQQQFNDVYQTQPQDFDGDNDDQMLRKLLRKFQMSFLYPFLKAYDITYRSLRYLSVDDINTTIRSVGHRAEFREKLFAWRRKRYRTNDVIVEHEKLPHIAAPTTATVTTSDAVQTEAVPAKIRNTKRLNSPNSNASASTESQSNSIQATTTYPNPMHPTIKRKSSAIETSSLQYLISEIPSDMEINELDAMDAKRVKFENVVELRENRLNAQLNLEDLLADSVFGPVVKAYYAKYGYLERKHRDELINAVVNYVTANEMKLHSSDFSKIVDMIVNMFPTEEESRDYYYINRHGKRNPMGRLYTKYYNTLKRMRVRDIHQEFTQESAPYLQTATLADDSMLGTTGTVATPTSTALMLRPTNGTNGNESNSSCSTGLAAVGNGNGNGDGDGIGNCGANNTQIELIEDEFQELIQLDDTSVSAIKNFLRCQGLDWDDIKTMWSKTYLSRQEDVEHSTIKDVLQQWPKYLNARGIELFDIDFRLKFSRNKANVLQRKWPHFARKMSNYYQTNIKDEMCKGLYALWKTKPGKDTEDYILTVLLNAIMIPMARYHDAMGNRRKVAIVEAVDLFAIRVTNLEELDQKREEFSIKFGDIHTDFTPLIVVVGDNNINIHEIYVHFDIALYEMPDYLSALDACMQIYRVLNLPFPASNEYIWTFIQRYFYEILLPDDMKCPSMSTIISYLKF